MVYPLNPVTQLTVQQGAGDKFNLSFIIPSEVFREQWPDHTLRKLFLNVDDAHIDTVPAGELSHWRHDPFGGQLEDGFV